MPEIIAINSSTFKVDFSDMFEVEIGDADLLAAFRPHLRIKRKKYGAKSMDVYFPGTQGLMTVDVPNNKIGYAIDKDTRVEFYPVDPDTDHPEGAVEMNWILDKRPTGPGSNQIILKMETNSFDFEKILPLDQEWDQEKCIAKWNKKGEYPGPYIITPTVIIETTTGEVMLKRAENRVNSYRGKAKQATDVAHDYGEIKANTPNKGKHLFYHRVSRTHAYILRGQMEDAIGQKAWVEDITYDPVTKDLTFTLPAEFLKSAAYPIRQAVGVDPAYTEEMASYQGPGAGDGTWGPMSVTSFGLSTQTGGVYELMLENQQKGAENLIGVREIGSSLSRYVNLHEAEPDGGGDGDTHCRMFVQSTLAAYDYWQAYSEDVSDTYFYILGYWENVSFTEAWEQGTYGGDSETWIDADSDLSNLQADKVHQIIISYQGSTVDPALVGVRTGGSSLERKFLLHEAESGGDSCIDFLVKAASDGDIEIYEPNINPYSLYLHDAGYFSSELDFVELWQNHDASSDSGWYSWNISAYLDTNGRVVDVIGLNYTIASPVTIGAKDGDDTTTSRYLKEHESEDNGSSTGELTGFSLTATSNSSGVIKVYGGFPIYSILYYLTGYFKPAAGGGDAIFSSPCLFINEALVTPDLVRDHIFSSPLLSVDESVLNPSLRADRIMTAPYFDISEVVNTPTLLRESKPISPLLTINEALNIPDLVRDSVFASPYFDISEALNVPEVGIAIYLQSPLLAIDEALITPELFINSILSIPVLQIDEALMAPGLKRDNIFSSPKFNIDLAYLVPDIGIAIYITSPLLEIDLATIVPGLLRDTIFSSPSLGIDTAYIVPVIYVEGLTIIVVPLLNIDLATITPTLKRDGIFSSPKLSIDESLNIPTIGLSIGIVSPLLNIDEILNIPSLRLDQIFLSPVLEIIESLIVPVLTIDRIFSSPAVNIDEVLLVPVVYTTGAGDAIVIVPLLSVDEALNTPGLSLSRIFTSPAVNIDLSPIAPFVYATISFGTVRIFIPIGSKSKQIISVLSKSRQFISVGIRSRQFISPGSKSRMFVETDRKSRQFVSMKGGGHG